MYISFKFVKTVCAHVFMGIELVVQIFLTNNRGAWQQELHAYAEHNTIAAALFIANGEATNQKWLVREMAVTQST